MKYLFAFNNTRLQTVHFLEELARTEHAATTDVTLYDPISVKEAEEGLYSVKFFHKTKELPWTYRLDKAVFSENQDYIIFAGIFESLDLSKIGCMMRDFTRDLKVYKDVKEICFLGNIRGLLMASIFYRKFPELGNKIRCYSAEHYIGDLLGGVIVYPKPDETFLVLREEKHDPDAEKEVDIFAKMFVSSHITKMWIAYFTQTRDGEDFSAKFCGRVISGDESTRYRTGNKLIIFLPSAENEDMGEEMVNAARDTYKKIKDIMKNA